MSDVDTVRAIYEAFGRGDVPAILEHLADDVRWDHWEDNHSQRAGVPWMKERTGPEQVAEFFALVGAWDFKEFSVLGLMEGTGRVAAEVVLDGVNPETGARLRDEEIHLWTFDDAGKVTRFRHYTDTAKHVALASA